jgi:hypothetical protein
LVCLLAVPLHAQEPVAPSAEETINLFFDCQTGGCGDMDFLRREISYVNWVRDREDADVHVLVTSQGTGGGGRFFTLAFIGLGGLAGQEQELTVATRADATSDEQRNALATRLGLGLVAYVQGAPIAERLRVTFGDGGPSGGGRPGPPPGVAGQVDDPWDFWVFRLSASGNGSGQSTSSFTYWSGGISANRTTEAWKVDLSGSFFRNSQSFDFKDATGATQTVRETGQDWNTRASLVRSIGEQWAAGARAEAISSTVLNQDLTVSFQPGIEFDFFPYSESSRRSMTLQYLVGPTHFRYEKRTIFNQTVETRFQESLTARMSLIEPWGRWSTSVNASHYLHDPAKSNLTISGNANVRLFRGFSVNVSANYSWVRDQLYLSAEGATAEQVLLRQRQLETSFRYFYSFGVQYRFGSIFNNVVNPRFGGGGGGGDIIFIG